MHRLLIFILVFTPVCLKSQDIDNLKPDGSALTDFDLSNDYKSMIKKKLLADLSEFPIARTIVCPSFESEFVISIETKKIETRKNEEGIRYNYSKKYLILRTCDPSIWNSFKHNNDSSKVFTKEILIDSLFSQTIENLFKTALSKARFSFKPTHGLDGTNYYFITTVMHEGVHCGYTWSPDSATKMGGLCKISELLRDYCETKDERIKNIILIKSKELTGKFEENSLIKEQVNIERYIWILLSSLLLFVLIFLIIKLKIINPNTH